MATRDPETDPKAFLGDELRRARIAAGFASQEALAVRLGYDRTVVTKVERGDRAPTPEMLTAWCETCGLDPEHFGRLGTLARRADGPVPTWFEDWLKAEAEAHTLRFWQPLIVPGLLQTAGYARALFLAVGADDAKADELVAVRMERQQILDRADPPHLITVLDEGVLHKLIGSPAIMYEQVMHLADMAERPAVSLEIVPAATGANAGLSGGFQLASIDGTPDVLNMNGVRDVTEERGAIVRHATRIFDRARGDALPRAASRALILEAAEQWKTR
ncbi:MAG TPA: helix-turn-helix transcriptional regulator [Streptosporangiaceae bacterium]|jgi:transcriptional regulator with XRE-family HTH domain